MEAQRERGKLKGGISECVEEQPLLFFFSSPSVISTSSREREEENWEGGAGL
jgi:hypothetical protein